MSKRYLLILEIVWIITGSLCIVAGIRFLLNDHGPRIFIFAGMALVSFIFAWLRHRERKNQ